MTIIFDMFYGDKRLNEFMHAFDAFESGKQLATYHPFKIEITPKMGEEGKVKENIPKIFDHLMENTAKEYNLVFLSIRSVDDVPTNEYPIYLKEGVQTISDGEKWGIFHKMLKRLGYDVKHSKRMEVTEAKLIVD